MKLAFLILASIAGAAVGQVPQSDDEVQLKLETMAAAVQRQLGPGSPIQGVEVGPHRITLHFITPEYADVPLVRSTLRNVGRPLCSDANWAWFWSNGITVHLTGKSASGAQAAIEITAQSCSNPVDPSLETTSRSTAPSLAAFDFKGIVAGKKVDPHSVASCPRQKKNSPALECSIEDGMVGNLRVFPPVVTFYDGRLTSLGFFFSPGQFLQVVQTFQAKYGQPCESASESWKNLAGAEIPNTVVRWCFATGKLELRQIGSRADMGTAMYIDSYQRPSAPVPVNF